MRLLLLSITAALSPLLASADVQFTSPAAGASIPAGAITVTWADSGDTPSLSQLSGYQLFLMVGGNKEDDALQLANIASSTFKAGNTATGTIDPGTAESLDNGFYLKMISSATDGGVVVNYSDRFTVTGMTGSVSPDLEQAVTALGGTTAGPATKNDVVGRDPQGGVAVVPEPAASAPVAPAAEAQYNVPYAQQTGPIKYAPMQGIPPTKITARDTKPVYPTSQWTVAQTWLPKPTIVSTMTEPQTFSVKSRENTVAAQSKPSGDMAKFLARWKD